MTDKSIVQSTDDALPSPIEGTTIYLEQPITVKGVKTPSLVLRKPITADVIELSYPYLAVMRSDEETCIEFRAKVVARYISRLASIPMQSVLSMSIPDLQSCQAVIQGFFGRAASEDEPAQCKEGDAHASPNRDAVSA